MLFISFLLKQSKSELAINESLCRKRSTMAINAALDDGAQMALNDELH